MTDSVATEPPVGLTELVRATVRPHLDEPGALLPVLHDLQAALGYLPAAAIALIATELNLSRADVYGVVTFYRDFRDRPPAPSTVRICRAEACQSVGAEALVAHARTRLGTDLSSTTADGQVHLDQVFCLGNCALGPSVEIDGRVHGRVDATRLDALLAQARQ